MELQVTEHGERRMRKRQGLPRKAVHRMAEIALTEGIRPNRYAGSFKRYLDGVFLQTYKANNLRVYGGHLYLFDDACLITCWPIPSKFRNAKPS